jgi:hypothetical protein
MLLSAFPEAFRACLFAPSGISSTEPSTVHAGHRQALPADIVEGMLNEDRKMLTAVRERRIAVGIEIITQALRHGGRIVFVGAGRADVWESLSRPKCPRPSEPPGYLAVMAEDKTP